MTVEVISSAAEWRSALADIGEHDFVHTYDFHVASEANGDGSPIAFAVRGDGGGIEAFWPLLKRPIPDSTDFDLTSVYGYGGPLFRDGGSSALITALLNGMAATGAIGMFSRLHPLFDDHIDDPGRIAIGDVISIEVKPDDQPPQSYRTNHKRNIARMLREGFTTTSANDPNAFARFQQLYEAAMHQLQAAEYYYFKNAFYERIAAASDFRPLILFTQIDGRDVSGVLFTVCGTTMQYFLSATAPEFRAIAPSKLIIAEAHRIAAAEGLRNLLLGGGVGSQQDSLFNFKLGFSKCVLKQHVFRRIFNHDRYKALCAARGIDADSTAYFPAYRLAR